MDRICHSFPKSKRYVLLVLTAALLIVALPKPALAANTGRVIRVGCFPYDEFLYQDSQGNYAGYGYDYLQELAKYTGWRFAFVASTWEQAQTMLAKGEIDLLGAVIRSPEREERFAFSQFPMVSGYGVLATNLANDVLPYEDFEAFQRLRVGALSGNLQADHFFSYSRANGFTPSVLYFPTMIELMEALNRGDVQAVILTSILRSDELRVIAKFNSNDSYFATTKGNTEVLRALDYGMEQILLNNPYFSSNLNEKYFNLEKVTAISFTREELDYVAKSQPIRCAYYPAARPISYLDAGTGTIGGIAADVCRLLTEKTGLTFSYVPVERLQEAAELFRSGEIDIILTKTYSAAWAEQNDAYMTTPYLQGQTVMVSRENGQETRPVVALNEQALQTNLVTEIMAGARKIKRYPTLTDCLNAVRSGEADVTFVNSVIMSYESGNPKYSRLKLTHLYGYSADTCLAVREGAGPLLISIINKGLSNISAAESNNIMISNLKGEVFNDPLNLLYARPLESILTVGAILTGFALVLYLLFRSRAKSAKAMRGMLYTDALTGFPNYKFLLTEAPLLIGSRPERYALIYMDMHQFKFVNDAFGYEAGDRLLQSISTLLHGFIEKDERFARIYADTFMLLLRYTDALAFARRTESLSQALEGLTAGELAGANLVFSGGVYHLQADYDNLERACDKANYAKGSIGECFSNTFAFYDEVLKGQIQAEKLLKNSMLPALTNGEFVPYYQPKVNVITGEIVGAEALVRWLHPTRGCLPPAAFLPFYEKNGFITKIDFTIFETVCANIRQWMDKGNPVVPVSVNFSRRHMKDAQFAQKLKTIVERYDLSPELLEIEITETIELETVDKAVEFVNALKRNGFTVSVDDYGSGYSSIALLQELPLDVLKLDRKFILNAMEIPKARDIMRYLITAMKNNRIRIICEGIETEAQRDFIVSLNCCFAQGYLYAKPLDREGFEEYLTSHAVSQSRDFDFVSIVNLSPLMWANSEDILSGVMPGWIMGCYIEEGFPYFYISPGLMDALGYCEPEFQETFGGLYINCLHPDDRAGTLADMEQADEVFHEAHLQYRMRKKDGGYLHIRDTSKRVLTDDGRPALLCVCTDITDIVTLQQENSSLMDAIPGGVGEMLLTGEGPILQKATDRFYFVIGHTPEAFERLGNNLFAVVHQADLANMIDELQHAINLSRTVCACTFRTVYADGSVHWINMRGTLHVDGEARFATVILYNMDVEMQNRQRAEIVKAKLELALMVTNHAIFEYDIATRTINEYVGLESFGFPGRSPKDVPDSLINSGYVFGEDIVKFAGMFLNVIEGASFASCEARLWGETAAAPANEAQYVWTRITLSTIYDDAGKPIKAVGVVEDIDRQKRYEHALVQEEQYRRALAEASLLTYDINLTADTVNRISGVRNERLMEINGLLHRPGSYTELLRAAVAEMLSAGDRERMLLEMGSENLLRLYENGVLEKEYEYKRLMPDGQEFWVSAFLHLLPDHMTGDVLCFVYYRDIHARKELESSLKHQAARDPLTDLLNRTSAKRFIGEFLEYEGNVSAIHAFLMIDVDHFKSINDTYGHQFGDIYLLELAKVIRDTVRDTDIVARIGGDEFAVFLKNIRDQASARDIAKKLYLAATKIGERLPTRVPSSVSIGISLSPRHGLDFASLYRRADEAMYLAKRNADIQIAVFGD